MCIRDRVISAEVMQDAEGTRIELKGRVDFDIDLNSLEIPPEPHYLSDKELYDEFEGHEHMMCIRDSSKEVSQRADFSLSFSKMTFPHQMMRVILLEQIYRSFKIIKNEAYHK